MSTTKTPKQQAGGKPDQKPVVSPRILTADYLVVDDLITLPTPEELEKSSVNVRNRYERLEASLKKLLAKNGRQFGDKIAINEEDFKELLVTAAGLSSKMEAGGSTADILTTVKHLLGNQASVDYLGIAGQDNIHDNLITGDLKRNGIKLEPGPVAGGKSAMSFVFTHPYGKHTIVTYPGNAAEKLSADMVTHERVAKSDIAFLPISLWSKLNPAVPETLLQKAVEQDKQIIVSIPKQARFGASGSEDIHKRFIPNADIIVADEEELARWYKTGDNYELAVQKLQTDLAQRDIVRAANGKKPRDKPATALIKHKDDSATVLVAQSPPGISPLVPAARYEIAAPAAIMGKKHSLGVDDAMYAGFITALANGLPPQNAGEYAMDVAQTKFQYDAPRIPSPIGATKATQQNWNGLRSGLSDTIADLESAIGFARTGVGNAFGTKLPRTFGQRLFDFFLYPIIANIGVFVLSYYVTYHSNFNQNKANWFVKRSSWFKDQLSKIPGLGESQQLVRNLNMVIWSFVDGSLMAPVVAFVESKRQNISRWFDRQFGTTPEDTSVYDKEIQRGVWDIIKARAATFIFVIATYFTLNAKILPENKYKGILSEKTLNKGDFEREKVRSINGFVFDVAAKKIGGWLAEIPSIFKRAENLSNSQLSKMSEITNKLAAEGNLADHLRVPLRSATPNDALYQIEGAVNTGIFEFAYTSLTTAGLYVLGKFFASKSKNKNEAAEASVKSTDPVSEFLPTIDKAHNTINNPSSTKWSDAKTPKAKLEKNENYIKTVDKSRSPETVHIGH